jgi:hypothetical protein
MGALFEKLLRPLLVELAGAELNPLPEPRDGVDVDVTPFLGVYERASVRMEVLAGADGPMLRTTLLGPLAELEPDPVDEYALTPISDGVFAVREPGTQTWITTTFYSLPTGEEYVHFGARATPKVASPQ